MKQMKEVLIYILLLSIILFGMLFVLMDINHKNNESITAVFISFVNVVITGILTYFLLITTKKQTDTNEIIVKMTLIDMYPKQKALIHKKVLKIHSYLFDIEELIKYFIFHIQPDEICDFVLEDLNDKNFYFMQDDTKVKLNTERLTKIIEDIQVFNCYIDSNENTSDIEFMIMNCDGFNEVYKYFSDRTNFYKIEQNNYLQAKTSFEKIKDIKTDEDILEYYDSFNKMNIFEWLFKPTLEDNFKNTKAINDKSSYTSLIYLEELIKILLELEKDLLEKHKIISEYIKS